MPFWSESHLAAGATSAAPRWAISSASQGGAFNDATYVLIASVSPQAGAVQVSVLLDDGSTLARNFAVAAEGRLTVSIEADFPEAAGRRFGVMVEALGANPPTLVVECATYSDAEGVRWAAGRVSRATPLP